MPRPRLARLGLVLSTLTAACDADTSGWTGTVEDSAGVAVVVNPAAGTWEGDSPWSFTEELRIGGLDAPTESQFGLVPGLDVDGAGNVYVLDMQAAQVRAFSPAGEHLRTLGRPGGGPGELSPQTGAVFVMDDEVWVADLGNSRITRYGVDGSEMSAIPLDLAKGIPIRWDELAGDRVVAQLRSMSAMGMGGEGDGGSAAGDAIVTMGTETPDTLATLPHGTTVSFQGGAARFRFFDPEPLWDAAADGSILVARNDLYRVEVRDADGELLRVVKKPFEARAVTESEKRAMLDAIGDMMREQGGVPPEMVDQILQGASFADTYPAMAQVLSGPDGTLWVQRMSTPEEFAAAGSIDLQDLGSTRWEVFDDEGRYLGVLELPARFQPTRIIGDAFWGVQRDDLDVPSVVRYRLVR
jgi:hypothetical protein